ncbi:SDR family oxidoreductase [Pendulispora rubella]|uniref:SDR family oxidoreductase n=1 Tax=Pendulispora rubella TaxID=2741070 RepID=A0ABZ2L0W7_9BACT
MNLLEGRAAIVTGSGSGIGRAIADTFLRYGAKVVLNDVHQAVAERARSQMSHPEHCIVVAGDITEPAVVDSIVGRCRDQFGQLDILVNNAGISPGGLVKTHSMDEWQRAFDVNVEAPFFLAQAALPLLMTSRAGRIINIASEIAFHGMMYQAAYAASKAAVNALTKCLTRAVSRYGITANSICPGVIPETNLVKGFTEDRPEYAGILKFYQDTCPLQRSGLAVDIANVAVMVASDLGSYLNGQLVTVNGGTF